MPLCSIALPLPLLTFRDNRYFFGRSEDEEDALRKPLQGLFEDVKSDISGVKDDLQDVIAMLKGQDLDFALQFTNYR